MSPCPPGVYEMSELPQTAIAVPQSDCANKICENMINKTSNVFFMRINFKTNSKSV
ncbi:hypothetical protein KCF3NO3_19040 [Chryseobacterium sp. KCF3-3]